MSTPGAESERRPWGPAVLLCATVLLVPVGAPGATVSIPALATDLDAPAAVTNWVINAFMLAFASALAVAGALADRWGRRRMLAIGLLIFVAGNLLIAAAPAIWAVVLGRAVSGIGAAAITTGGSALLSSSYRGAQRATVFAILGTSLGLGLAFGPTLSGLAITAVGSWRGLYLVYAAVAVPSLLLARRVLPRELAVSRPERFDLAGALTWTVALAAFMIAVSLGPEAGWVSWPTAAAFGVSVLAAIAFLAAERRADQPLIELALLRVRQFGAVCLAVTLAAFGFVSLVFTLGVFLSVAHGASALGTGLMLLALTAPTLVVPMLIGRVAHRLSLRWLLPGSMLVIALGCVLLAAVGPDGPMLIAGPPMVIIGAGFGLSLAVLDGAALAVAPAGREGMAAGMFNTVRVGTEAIAVVVVTAVVHTVTSTRVGAPAAAALLSGRPAAGAAGIAAYAAGWQVALVAIAALCAAGAFVIRRQLRPERDAGGLRRSQGAGRGSRRRASAGPAAYAPRS